MAPAVRSAVNMDKSNKIQYNTIQYNTIQYNTTQYLTCACRDTSITHKNEVCLALLCGAESVAYGIVGEIFGQKRAGRLSLTRQYLVVIAGTGSTDVPSHEHRFIRRCCAVAHDVAAQRVYLEHRIYNMNRFSRIAPVGVWKQLADASSHFMFRS